MEDILTTTASPFDLSAGLGLLGNDGYRLPGALDNHQNFGTALSAPQAISIISSELEQLATNPAITAIATGSPTPSKVTAPDAVTNGDFLIQANQSGSLDPLVGDGWDESTSWTFDFTQDPDFSSLTDSTLLASAQLTLTLKPTHQFVNTDSLWLKDLGLITKPIQSLRAGKTKTITIDLFDYFSPDQVVQALQSNAGKVSAVYQDDAIVSFAKLELSTFDSGVFTVGETGEVNIDFLFDGSGYRGELALFSLEGMGQYQPGSKDFVEEAARRALTNSELGHIVISDRVEGARFSGALPHEKDFNAGEYSGVKTFDLRPGEQFGFMLVPDGWVQQVFENPGIGGSRRPMFSMSTAASANTSQFTQLVDVTADGNSFSFEDRLLSSNSDRDYNDLIFQVQGAIAQAPLLDDVINPAKDWRGTEFGEALISYLNYSNEGINPIQLSEPVEYAIERAANLESYDVEELSRTSQWAVGVSTNQSSETLATLLNIENLGASGHIPNTYIFEFPGNSSSAKAARKLNSLAGVEFFYPLVPQETQPKFIPNDPLFQDQWHLRNTGQTFGTPGADANVETAWDLVRGTGIVIGIVDDGLQHTHPDLIAQYRPDLSYDFKDNDSDPSPEDSNDGHGTSVAGVAAARGNNNLGVSGAAPEAFLAGIRLTDGHTTGKQKADALSYMNQEIDIYNNSWGATDDGRRLGDSDPMTLAALENGILNGRNGLGSIYVWAAGNGLGNNDNVNYSGYENSRYTIAVSAIDDNGRQSVYSEPGAPILVAAYSGSRDIVTTDLVGTDGYNLNDYTLSFRGTSAAAPLVSGIIALMLQANPTLTWRDVQHILVNTAEQNDPTDSGWTTNGAGHHINHKYGFGAIDATAAVNAALTWSSVEPEISTTSGKIELKQTIPDDNPIGISSTVNITENITVESIEIVFDADHPFRGDLEIVLTSPDGTQSILAEPRADSNNNYDNWVFTSTRHWGESSLGDWTLQVFDKNGREVGTWNSWKLNIYGTPAPISETPGFSVFYEGGQDWGEDNYATSIAFGDIDGDGKDEIGIARKSDQNARYFILDDDFTILYEGGSNWGGGNYATSIAFGDIDGDGRDEIGITRKSDQNARYFILDSDFTLLHNGGNDWGGDNYATSIAFGDVDGDGRDEIGVARKSDQNARYFILDDNFNPLHNGGNDWGGDNYATSIAFGDVDEDGKDEIGVARKSDQNARYFILDDNFNPLHEGGQNWGASNYATSIAFGDTDGNGTDEIGIARETPDNARYFILNYDSDAASFTTIDQGGEDWGGDNYATSIAFGDVNGDGTNDVGIARWTRDNARYFVLDNEFRTLYEGGSDWGGGGLFGEPNFATSIAFGDINGDGTDELGVTRRAPENARYYILGL